MITVYISYAHGGESETMAEQVEQILNENGYTTKLDKKDIAYRDDIEKFERRLGSGDCIVTIISDKYLKSVHCMLEMLYIHNHEKVQKRIFPIVLEDAVKIYKPLNSIDYIEYWQNEEKKLNSRLNQLGVIPGLGQSHVEYTKIHNIIGNISSILTVLKRMNALTAEEHRSTNFSELLQRLPKQEESKKTDSSQETNQQAVKPEEDAPKGMGEAQSNAPKDFIYVEGGTFTMGSPSSEKGRNDDEEQHEVTLSSFYMGKYTVTQAQWRAVMGDKPSSFEGSRHPVESVSWYRAVEYCNHLSEKEGRQVVYSIKGENVTANWNANGYRLPTEAEWEYATRGGKKSRGYVYSGSNNVDEVAWYGDNSGKKTHEVGTRKANELGLYDMSGNVWEWCWDWYESYSRSTETDPTGPSTGSYRVLRGGGWNNFARYVRVAYRSFYSPGFSFHYIGFRLVLPVL